MDYFKNKTDVVAYVGGMLPHLDKSSAWTMTIKQVRSGDYSVQTAIDTLSDDTEQETVARFFSETQLNT